MQTTPILLPDIHPTLRRFNVEEYYRMGEAGIFHPEERFELIEGEIIPMGEGPNRRPFTGEQYQRLIEVGILREEERLELIEGDIIQMPPIGALHAAQVRKLVNLLKERW